MSVDLNRVKMEESVLLMEIHIPAIVYSLIMAKTAKQVHICPIWELKIAF